MLDSNKPEEGCNSKIELLTADLALTLHRLAAVILFLFAISHFAFLAIRDASHNVPNTVFPFINNSTLYFVAAILESAAAICCLKWGGQSMANVTIVLFISTMLWYGWAFSYTGGTHCSCLGLLGKLVRVSKDQEERMRIVTLIALGLTTTPGILLAVRTRMHRVIWLASPPLIAILPLHGMAAEQTIEVRGIVHAANYNTHTGQVDSDTDARSTFVAIISGSAWKVSVTNSERPGVLWWAERFYDGTNTYVLKPASGGFWRKNPPQNDLRLATVSPSPNAITLDGDPLGSGLVSITYGLSPQSLKPNQGGFIEIPLPWTSTRNNPDAFGFKLLLPTSEDTRFLREFRVYAESALNLSQKQELLRWELDYPETIAEYTAYQQALLNRMASPSYMRARYECTEWFDTNGLTVPKISRLEVFHPQPSNNPARIFSLEAKEVFVRKGVERIVPEVTSNTKFFDYRYKRANTERIFKYAEYTLSPGDSLKAANDPQLLAVAEDWLRNGRKYTNFAETGKRWATWLVLAVLVIPALAMLLRRVAANQKTNKIVKEKV